MFEVVFDYTAPGLNATPTADVANTNNWFVRADPFSSHRAGFEVRTYRLCRRVLMFHRFEAELGAADYLVRSTDFEYAQPAALTNPEQPGYTVLQSVTQRAYQKILRTGTDYESRQWPPVSFTYSPPKVDSTIHSIASDQLENLSVGTQGPGYQWLDLDGEGLSGVLAEHAGGWYYKPNRGDGEFGPLRAVSPLPAIALAAGSRHQFMDLAGDGTIDVVDFGGPAPGFHERDRDAGWKHHVPFASLPNIDWQDPNLRFVDLTGDGHADALITEQDIFTWYPSLDERGFAAAERAQPAADEDAGPRLVFADGTETIFLADMCGDGLTDLVRIRNGEVCYWPNLGYGRFGRKITLDNSPRFDHPDLFNPARIRLTDIDGSGPIDIIYLGRDGARLYFNRSGNSLSDGLTVALPVATENLGAVQVADLLGNGTACLVWNSHLPADTGHPVRYIDLMAGVRITYADRQAQRKHEKPHLLIKVENNLGATTEIEYTPSTRFYLEDLKAGTPWVTRLPFPVHCVSKVTARDKWRGTAFSSTYSYHHGYFDGAEREFRGFGRVEVLDVERYDTTITNNIGSLWVTDDHTLYQPPVKSVTWYHTGAALDRKRILDQFAHEYFPHRYAARLPNLTIEPNAFHENQLPQPELPAGLDADEWREALRACKGMVLRQETYELDVDELTGPAPRHTPIRLFSAATHNCNIQRIQPRGANKHAVFLVTESEALTYHYELDLRGSAALRPDPRIAHTLNVRHDEHGNPQQSIAIGYARWQDGDHAGLPRPELIAQVQSEQHLAYSEMRYTRDVLLPSPATHPNDALRHHRLRVPCEALAYELKGIPKIDTHYYGLGDLRACDLSEKYGHGAGETPPTNAVQFKRYHEVADGSAPQKRIVEHACSRYFDDSRDSAPPDKDHLLPIGQHGPRGFKYEDYKLALTSELLQAVFALKLLDPVRTGLTAQQMLDDPKISGYIRGVDIDPAFTGQYWMRSGTAGFAARAHEHFYLPGEFIDPFDSITTLTYDNRDLFIRSSEDALGNSSGIWLDKVTHQPRFDYRVLAPIEMADASGNRSEVYFDARGMVVAAAVKGKGSDADDLIDFDYDLANPSAAAVQEFCAATEMNVATAGRWLASASARFVYHFGEGRDTNGTFTGWVDRPAGACGIVRERHATQVALDPAHDNPIHVSLECSDGGGNVLMKKVQAEPDPTLPTAEQKLRWIINGLTVLNNKGKPVKQYEPGFSAIGFGCERPPAEGVTAVIYYDAAGRVVRTEMPDGSYSRVEFTPWVARSFDANDTVLETGNAWYARLISASATPEEQRAARLAATHADTPSEVHLDSLGREVIAIAHNRTNGVDEKYLTFTKLDAEGKPLWIRDARGNLVMQYITPAKANNDPSDGLPGNAVPCYDIAGNLLFQHSMDAGDRWMLMDAAGKPMLAWDMNETPQGTAVTRDNRIYSTDYDKLHRPVAQWLSIYTDPRILVEKYEYQDAMSDDDDNLNGQLIRHYDSSGRVEMKRRDFKGNVREVHRTLSNAPTESVIDWQTNPASQLERDIYVQITQHDALNRMTRLYNWHLPEEPRIAIYLPSYNKRGALASEDLVMRATSYDPDAGTGTRTTVIQEIRYSAKGQKEYLRLDNGTITQYDYDEKTLRLRQLRTTRPLYAPPFPQYRSDLKDAKVLQQLHYTYDPVGNISEITDEAYKPAFFQNALIEPRSLYEYDALYRLIKASGRESGANTGSPTHIEGLADLVNFPVTAADALRKYDQDYEYDSVGNIQRMHHSAGNGTWTRNYQYAPDSNRLTGTDTDNPLKAISYEYDTHGSMLNLANVPDEYRLQWDHRDMIKRIDLGGGGTAYYQYDSGKQRTRKRIVSQNGIGYWERIYLGGYERYRRYNGNGSTLVEEIESHHLFEGEQRVLLVDDVITTSRRHANDVPFKREPIYRYQYSNHLGSACLELDERAEIISYEEYHPYGTSAYRLMKSGTEAPATRYRYTGMERDEESGLGYHAARYCSALLARWISTDPTGLSDGLNIYLYATCNPINHVDATGKQSLPFVEQMYLIESVEVPTWALRGKTEAYHDLIRRFVSSEAYSYGLDPAAFVNGHAPSTPHYSTPAGKPQTINPQTSTSNTYDSALERAAAGQIRESNARLRAEGKSGRLQFLRENRIDVSAPKGMKTPGDVPEFVRTQAEAFDPAKPPPRPTKTSGLSLSPEPVQTVLALGPTVSIKGEVPAPKATTLEMDLGATKSFKPKTFTSPGESGSASIGTALQMPATMFSVIVWFDIVLPESVSKVTTTPVLNSIFRMGNSVAEAYAQGDYAVSTFIGGGQMASVNETTQDYIDRQLDSTGAPSKADTRVMKSQGYNYVGLSADKGRIWNDVRIRRVR
ncbi:MAG: toxin TcdB middle/N-terminal domain-containing protein [Vicinamibacterales bacterium]